MFATISARVFHARPAGSREARTLFDRPSHSIMARRTKAAAAATREALLDAAEVVFRDKGVAHASLAEIAAAAKVTRGAIYWHFNDKAELFKALCERVKLPMESMLAVAGGVAQADPLGKLRELSVSMLEQLASDPRTQAVFDVVFHKCEFAAETATVDERRASADDACLRNVERLLKQAVARRQLPNDTDTRLAALSLNAFVVGVMHQWVQRPAAYDLHRAAPQLIDLVLAGLRASPPRRAGASRRSAPSARRPRHTTAHPTRVV
jgi:TetR/AcrR family acrAB operon transcriptional repressor